VRSASLVFLIAAGCAQAPLDPPSIPQGGTHIYTGDVRGPDGDPLFRYTRQSVTSEAGWTSVHRSREVETDTLVVAQAARHDASYALQRYDEDHRQLGIRSTVSAANPGRLEFVTQRRNRVRRRSEQIDAPAVTGPTLFGFVTTRWDALAAGEAVKIRFIVAERRRSYAFTLRMASTDTEHTVVEMRPKSLLLRRALPLMRMTFDTRSRTILRYEGRIPPRHDERPVDAHVDYRHHDTFR